jgi:hypothetical protein
MQKGAERKSNGLPVRLLAHNAQASGRTQTGKSQISKVKTAHGRFQNADVRMQKAERPDYG